MMFEIKKIDTDLDRLIKAQIDSKTKPPSALGQLEELAFQIARIFRVKQEMSIIIQLPTMLVFAGDHGIAKQGVSIAPSEVTQQMVRNFLDGGAAINCFCRSNKMDIAIIDAGILTKIDDKRLMQNSLGQGTNNFVEEPAMSLEQVYRGLELGRDVARKYTDKGTNVIGFGEMGIGNTSAASAIQCLIMNLEVDQCVGRGTGISDHAYQLKKTLIKNAVKLHRDLFGKKIADPMNVLAAVGGFEIVQMVGAMLGAAEAKSLLLVDGYIATAAAMLAIKIDPNSREYMVFCHQSKEQGHGLMLESLHATPLLSLGLALGEGTGAALALPLINAAASFYNDMASFDSAGVTAV
jgi:nicotinate-nucleotide--dimethylbenzimidazole phosphoribosyltransferase